MVETCIQNNVISHVSCISTNIERLTLSIDHNQKKNSLKKTFYFKVKKHIPNNFVVNLSDLPLSTTDLSVLNKGLKYVPTPTTVNTRQFVNAAFEKICNRMSTIYYFRANPKPQNTLHRKSNWIAPNPKNKSLLNFFDFLKRDLDIFTDKMPILTNKKKNLTSKEQLCLTQLSKNEKLVIKKADKGGSIVIMNRDSYLKKVYDHLNDHKYYAKLTTDPTKDLITNINSFIETAVNHYLLSENTAKFITPTTNQRIPLFYILPKIHKKDIPGRPIVSAINSVTENMSEFLNLCIQPLLPKLRSYIKDTKHFVSLMTKLPKQNKGVILVSADITSLYTNIPHNEGIEACIHYMKEFKNVLPDFTPNERITRTLFLFILENNYFQFLDQLFVQLIGTAMGTKVAPPYASLFLGLFEETHIFTKFPGLITIFLRFLDDIFMIWKHGEEELHKFFKHLNSVHPTIKFTYVFSYEEINFLDTTVYIDKHTREIKTKLFVKPTDTRTLLHYDSYHPDHTKQSIVYSQALRYRMITTDDELLYKELNKLKTNLTCRGYKSQLVDLMFNKATKFKQMEVLQSLPHASCCERIKPTYKTVRNPYNTPKKGNNLLPFVIPYHKEFLLLKEILYKNWYIIDSDETLRAVFLNKPFLSFTRHKNIHDYLVRTKMGFELSLD